MAQLLRAEILAVGSELLGYSRLDTNSLFLTRALLTLGIPVVAKSVLPDDQSALAAAIAAALRRSEVVICTGGLGPTEDDRTVAAAAQALGCSLIPDPAVARHLRQWFHRRHRRFTARQLHQTLRLEPAVWLPNRVGTAAGQWCLQAGRVLVLLPGPPPELEAMFEAYVRPGLAVLAPAAAHAERVLSIAGLGESQVDDIAAPIYRRFTNPATTILATAAPQVELHFNASASTPRAAQARADAVARAIERRLGSAVFSRNGDSLAAVVGSLLLRCHATLAVAESCTGGLLAASLTSEPGASRYFLGGVVSYENEVKRALLGVREGTLRRYGAVSAATAREMAAGVCARLDATWGLSVTGIAGPSGGSPSKPVGTVYIGLAHRSMGTTARRFRFFGDRDRIRRFSAQTALNHLRLHLLGLPPAPAVTPRHPRAAASL